MSPTPSAPSYAPLGAEDRAALLRLARQALERYLAHGEILERRPPGSVLHESRGLFVTLRRRDELVGCIGWVTSDEPLYRAVVRCAIAAATKDPRFPPVRGEELPEVRIEISVLSPLEPVRSPEEIVVGRDGLLLEKEGRRGLLLPQVATEQGWDLQALLEGVCRKAGLPSGAWRQGAPVRRFTAEVFAEIA